MADIYWIGGATAVAQVDTASIDSVDGTPANNTFTITVGDASASVPGNSTAAQTATDLVGAANLVTHAHMAAITFANPSGGNITATADVAGVPFVATLSVSGGGTGAVTDFAETTANAGPSSLKSTANYSGGALPTASDTLTIRESDDAICYDLDAVGNIGALVVEQSFTGTLGLSETVFARDADGGNTTAVREYRETSLTSIIGSIVIGRHTGTGSPSGSTRIKIHNTNTSASTAEVIDTSTTSAETFKPPVRLLGSSANFDIYVRDGIVGIAADRDAETATVGDITATGDGAEVTVGAGTTFTSWSQAGGTHHIHGAGGNVTSVSGTGGTLTIDGDFLITTLTVDGMTCIDNHAPASGNAATTVVVRDGTLDLQQSDIARSYGTLTWGGTIRDNPAVTITTINRARATITA